MASEMPWIPRKYYAAVMYACKTIRETGWYNKAIEWAADKYNVDEDIIKKYVDERSHAKPRKSGYKMHWFVYGWTQDTDAQGLTGYGHAVAYGKSRETVESRLREKDFWKTYHHDYGGAFSPTFCSYVLKQYDTKAEAEADAKKRDAEGRIPRNEKWEED